MSANDVMEHFAFPRNIDFADNDQGFENKEQRMDLYDDLRGWSPIQFLTPTDRA